MKKQTHTGAHKYFSAVFKKSGTKIFRCGISGCGHFVYEPLIIGRESVCWRCSEIFEIVRKTLRNKKFHCVDCTKSPGNTVSVADLKKLMGV
jgi:hypothetical protein